MTPQPSIFRTWFLVLLLNWMGKDQLEFLRLKIMYWQLPTKNNAQLAYFNLGLSVHNALFIQQPKGK